MSQTRNSSVSSGASEGSMASADLFWRPKDQRVDVGVANASMQGLAIGCTATGGGDEEGGVEELEEVEDSFKYDTKTITSFNNYSFGADVDEDQESEDTLHDLSPRLGSSEQIDTDERSRKSESETTAQRRRQLRNLHLDIARSNSIPNSSTLLPPLARRRPSRKQPPRLTESLERLDTASQMSVSVSSASPPLEPIALPSNRSARSSESESGTGRYTLEVDRVQAGSSEYVDRTPVEYRKPSKTLFSRFDRRKSSLTPLTADSIGPVMTNGPRMSLFGGTVAQRAVGQLDSIDSSPSTPVLSCSGTATESTCGTWDMDERPVGKESRKARKARRKIEAGRFDATTPPTRRELFDASAIEVLDEHGERVRFGDLIRGRRTIVVFLRHWFCSMCAQYMMSIVKEVRRDSLDEAGVDLIVVGNGSAKMIDGYAYKHFKSPFKTYTDPSLLLYRALGLTRQTGDGGKDEDKGAYLVESVMEQTVSTLKRATKMPLRNPGHFTQLGGEFIFDGPLNVVYTHRMVNTRDHAPIRDVCAEAGVRLRYIHYDPGSEPRHLHHESSTTLESHSPVPTPQRFESPTRDRVLVVGTDEVTDQGDDLDDWQAQRERTLEKIRMLRAGRIGVVPDREEVEDFGYMAHNRLVV